MGNATRLKSFAGSCASKLGLGLIVLLTALAVSPAMSSAGFVKSWDAGTYSNAGATDWVLQAGVTPRVAATDLHIHFDYTRPNLRGIEHARDIIVETPPGFVANPLATPRCTHAQLRDRGPSQVYDCPPGSMVGALDFPNGTPVFNAPVFNMVPRRGVAAEFGVKPVVPIYLTAHVTADGRIEVRSKDTSQAVSAYQYFFRFFGVPKDEQRNLGQYSLASFSPGNLDAMPRRPFVRNPTSCTGPVDTLLTTRSWQTPDVWEKWTATTPGGGYGCELLPFEPTSSVTIDKGAASSPAGLSFDMQVPQNFEDPEGLATAHVKKVEVQLPEGVRVNPSLADGLAGCTTAQINLKSTAIESCPAGSRIGSVEASSPLLEESIGGHVYLAQPFDNPFNSLIAVYVVAVNNERGIRLKIPGVVRPDPVTGQLTAVFDDNPQLPYDRLSVKFNGGDRAPLLLPEQCGAHEVKVAITPWSAADPDNPTEAETVRSTSTIHVNSGPNGRPCGTGFDPGFRAGTELAAAGESSPFRLTVWRDDSDQEFRQLDQIKLPQGLLGRIADVELCPDAQADAGTCGEASRIGHVQAAIGGGPAPAWVPQAGKRPTSVHLSGPYQGAPYGLSIVVPAQAGPFELGTVVVRAALHVDERTAAITARVVESRVYGTDGTLKQQIAGGLPRIIDGIVLSQREIRMIVDRPGFMINPTNCSTKQIPAELFGYGGGHAAVSDRFQINGCRQLDFAPRFRAQIMDKGRRSTLRSFHPRTRFVVVPRKGDANIGAARVVLPSSTILDQANIGTTCTRAQMAAEDCPRVSIVGHARAWSPVLNRPIQGPVYLAANGGVRPLPDLAAVMDGEVKLVLQGEISTLRTGRKARLQNTFRMVPDAPVSRFVLTMRGGKNRGLLVNSGDLCRTNERGVAVFTGQNGKRQRLRPRIATRFKGCKQVRRKAAKRQKARKSALRSAAREAR